MDLWSLNVLAVTMIPLAVGNPDGATTQERRDGRLLRLDLYACASKRPFAIEVLCTSQDGFKESMDVVGRDRDGHLVLSDLAVNVTVSDSSGVRRSSQYTK